MQTLIHIKRATRALLEKDWRWSEHDFSWAGYRLQSTEQRTKHFSYILFFSNIQIHPQFQLFFFSSFLIKKAQRLRASASPHPCYFYPSPPASPESTDGVQPLAWSLEPFPESSLQDSNASVTFCISGPIFGAQRLIFFLPPSESPECVLPARLLPRGTNNATTRINLKNSSRGSLPTTSVLLTRLSAPYINEGKPCSPAFPQQPHAGLICGWIFSPAQKVYTQPISACMNIQDGIWKSDLKITSWSRAAVKKINK